MNDPEELLTIALDGLNGLSSLACTLSGPLDHLTGDELHALLLPISKNIHEAKDGLNQRVSSKGSSSA